MEYVSEPARSVPVRGRVDVLVAGGGPAGIAAALRAAMAGARTLLIERSGALGGMWTGGLLGWILDGDKPESRILGTLRSRLRASGFGQSAPDGSAFAFSPEAMKGLLDELCAEGSVAVRLHSPVAGVVLDRPGHVGALVTESKSGREAWRAGVFVDATGDGDVAARAGCGFDQGDPVDGRCQPMSLLALVTGLDPEAVREFTVARGDWNEVTGRLRRELVAAGAPPSYRAPSLFHLHDQLFYLMANHIYRHNGLDADAVSGALRAARREVAEQAAALRRRGGVWRRLTLVATGETVGVRETRRIHGHYTVTLDDVVSGRRHEDAVCRVHFPVDIHAPDPSAADGGILAPERPSLPYDIPLRALIPRDADNLLLAGRCLSGDFHAHASYRVTGDAVATGEAAGVLAALAARSGTPPERVPFSEVRRELFGDVVRVEALGGAPMAAPRAAAVL